MDHQSLTKQIKDAFVKLEKSDRKDLLKSIQALTSKAGESTERIAVLLFTLIVIFLLIDLKLTREGSLLGFKFDNLTSIEILIPVLVSYVYLDFAINVSKVERLSKICRVVAEELYPSIVKSNLTDDFIFIPSLIESRFFHNESSFLLRRIFFFAATVLPVLFIGYAVWRLFILMREPNINLMSEIMVCIVLALLFTIQSILILSHLFSEIFKKQ